MLIGTSYKNYIFPLQPQVSCINIGRDINSGKVTNMNRPVCIRKAEVTVYLLNLRSFDGSSI